MSVQALPTLCLVRHGETAWTISGQHTGHSDIPLTEKGEQAVRALAPRLRDWNFTQVFTSPLQRARRTAELAGFGEAIPDTDLMEWDYGAYEGRRTLEIRAERPGWRLFDDGCPGGETLEAVGARADRVIDRIRACPGDVLVFAHGHILRVLIARWLGLAPRDARCFELAPASISLLGYERERDEPILRRLNDTAQPHFT